jgi:hypothetical protein
MKTAEAASLMQTQQSGTSGWSWFFNARGGCSHVRVVRCQQPLQTRTGK